MAEITFYDTHAADIAVEETLVPNPLPKVDLPDLSPLPTSLLLSPPDFLPDSSWQLLPPKKDAQAKLVWTPSDWQLSLSTRYLHADHAAGLFNDGLHPKSLTSNADGTFTAGIDGWSTAEAQTPVDLELNYVRKRSDPSGPGRFESKGPSFQLGLGYQGYEFVDHGWNATLSSAQVEEAFGTTSEQIGEQFDADAPDSDGVQSMEDAEEYVDDLEAWANSNASGFANIPALIEHMFDTYDPSKDVAAGFTESETYLVPALHLNTNLSLESSVWDYSKAFNFFNEGKISLQGSAIVFLNPDFNSNLYLGVGPYLEWSLVSYNYKSKKSDTLERKGSLPLFTAKTFIYAGMQYYNGYSFEEGFSSNDRFVDGKIGLGARVVIPNL